MTPDERSAKLAELRELVIAGMTGGRKDADRVAELMAELYPERE